MLWGLSFFCFARRRRHTRSLCDWSSDVCSSDLVDLHRRGRFGHHDHRADAELLGGVRDGLAVVAGGEGDNPALPRGIRELPDRVVGAADLEGADRLLVLELQVRAERFDVAERRADRDTLEAGGSLADLFGGDHPTSSSAWAWAWPWVWPWARRRFPRPPHPLLPSRRAPRPRPGRRR